MTHILDINYKSSFICYHAFTWIFVYTYTNRKYNYVNILISIHLNFKFQENTHIIEPES